MKGRAPLWLLLALSLGLRVLLARRGGQLYFPDEQNYFGGLALLGALGRLDAGAALSLLLRTPYHTGFVVVAAVPAWVERLVGVPDGPQAGGQDPWVAAAVLACAAVAVIGLVHAIARRVGAGREEALLASLLCAASTSMFYFSRHLLPYDSALALGLWAMWIGLGAGRAWTRTLACGLVAGAAFFTYFGYWTLGAAAVVVHLARASRSPVEVLGRGALACACMISPPLVLTALSLMRGEAPFLGAMAEFAGTIDQGDVREGWSLPWVYLWHAERSLLVLWLAAASVAVGLLVREGRARHARGALWLATAGGIYAALALCSTGLGQFVVYGRLARQIVPFLCLAAAYGIAEGASRAARRRRALLAGTAILSVLAAAYGFARPFAMHYPRDVQRRVLAVYGAVPCAATVAGGTFTCDYLNVPRASLDARYVLLNAHILYPVTGPRRPPAGKVVLRVPHPEGFLPYQYEGYTPRERAILRATDISMRLIDRMASDASHSGGSQ